MTGAVADQDPIQAIPVPVEGKRRASRKRLRAELDIPKLTFRQLVQSIADGFRSDLRFQRDATDALQEAAESLLIGRFKKCSRLSELCRMDTLRKEHWDFLKAGDGLPATGE